MIESVQLDSCWAKGCLYPPIGMIRDINADVPTCRFHAEFLNEESGHLYDQPILETFLEDTAVPFHFVRHSETGKSVDDDLNLVGKYPWQRTNRIRNAWLTREAERMADRRQRERDRENRQIYVFQCREDSRLKREVARQTVQAERLAEKLAARYERLQIQKQREAGRILRREAWLELKSAKEAAYPIFQRQMQQLDNERRKIHSETQRLRWKLASEGQIWIPSRQEKYEVVRTRVWNQAISQVMTSTGANS